MRSDRKASRWRALASVLTGTLVATAAFAGVAAPAQAAQTVSASELTWGFKASWNSYVATFGGTATASGGAGLAGDEYVWSPAAGEFDPATAEGSAQFTGSVQFDVPSHGIALAVSDPRVVFAGGVGSVYWAAGDAATAVLGATISSVSFGAPAETDGAATVSVAATGVAFTAEGAEAFGGSYAAGDPMDDLAFALTYTSLPAAPTATSTTLAVSPAATSAPGADILLTATVAPAASGTVTFFDSGSPLGAPVPLVGDAATFTVEAAAAAAHGFSAAFTPTDAAAFTASTSATVAHTVAAQPVEPTPPVFTPALSVFLSDGVTPYTGQPVYTDDELIVRGSGFDPGANVGGRGVPIPSTLPQGTYVVLGSFLDEWKPSASAPSSTRKVVSQTWALAATVLDLVPAQYQSTIRAQWVELSQDGTFAATLTAQDFSSGLPAGNWGVYTYGAGGISNAAQELSVAVEYAGDRPGADPVIVPTVPPALQPAEPATVPQPAEPACVARAVSGADIQWGVKQSFRDYIAGGIAKGSISGGWGAGSGSYNTQEDRGRVGYGGSTSFAGHSGALEITLSNPRIQVHSATSASLIMGVQSTSYNGSPSVDAGSVVFATLTLPGAVESPSRIGWTGAAATLTAAGAEAFAGFYAAGTALDPVTFSFPLGAEVPCDAATSASLAVTGGEASIDALWLGIGMLIVGAGAFAVRRRSVRG
ncbi:HtaA domain-containing protein [Microbacterium sp. zg.B48]|uniref:HtaA domain-containing protein n=1 Tax=Microbacterium sp. zg.B48 TaxID=2969408 RepID=UPI00214D0960|nr:HtaA domain-containing protein [Microbacterium sp. zg.B48]MCR2762656.1 HtaA domain-containing protein [Microbacterium sp. zg.B48]